jgi:hypothetical protein
MGESRLGNKQRHHPAAITAREYGAVPIYRGFGVPKAYLGAEDGSLVLRPVTIRFIDGVIFDLFSNSYFLIYSWNV